MGDFLLVCPCSMQVVNIFSNEICYGCLNLWIEMVVKYFSPNLCQCCYQKNLVHYKPIHYKNGLGRSIVAVSVKS